MVKFPEAQLRLFKNTFICRKCKTKIRAPNMQVMAGTVKCRKCGRRYLRPVRKK